jgi:hypothetical protein
MRKLIALAVVLSLAALIGCSSDKDPVSSKPTTPANTPTSAWIDTGFWRTTVDATDTVVYAGYSFITKDTSSSDWDMAFRRDVVKLNGGSSTTNSGDAMGVNLGVVDFADVGISDTTGVTWLEDADGYFIDNWYDYNPNTHALTANRNVYSMVDAEGDNYVKFRIDSLVGAGMPPNMGTVYITYYYQPTANSRDLSGATSSAAITVGSGTGYFDFSSGSVVTPADPTTSTDWDLAFSMYNVMQNCSPAGPGACAAFYAYTELADPTNIDGFTAQPTIAPMFADGPSSVYTDWYTYTGAPLHRVYSKNYVYLVKTGGKVYKMKIESYYANIGGVLTSGWYTFIWKQL